MRTAFQIPFDATVRVSLDTNLCMISERGYDLQDMKVWHRDPSWILQPTDITRFPHAVLEIKLELKGGNMTPPKWVTDLQNSGLLYECHKYSKYCHGCAVLLPEDVRSVPYWVDDVSLRESIIASGGGRILADSEIGAGPGANQVYNHLLPFGDTAHNRKDTAVGRTHASAAASKGMIGEKGTGDSGFDYYDKPDDIYDDDEEGCCSWMFPFCSKYNNYSESIVAPTSIQKIEPKVFCKFIRTIPRRAASVIFSFTHLTPQSTHLDRYSCKRENIPPLASLCCNPIVHRLWNSCVLRTKRRNMG
jgi:hypothetical protein